jgi:hypothetical protein
VPSLPLSKVKSLITSLRAQDYELECVIITNESNSSGFLKKTWCFAPKACASWGTLVEPTNPFPQKNPKKGSNLGYLGTFMELNVVAFFSSNF